MVVRLWPRRGWSCCGREEEKQEESSEEIKRDSEFDSILRLVFYVFNKVSIIQFPRLSFLEIYQ
jgi:hypothetical protein